MTKKLLPFILLFLTINTNASSFNSKDLNVIYGNDDRHEVDEYYDQNYIEKAHSVAIRISNQNLSDEENNSGFVKFSSKKYSEIVPQLCKNERFYDQPNVGDCSAFLVSPNKIVTAGHCMIGESTCSSYKWVFDFKKGVTHFEKKNIYACKQIISHKYIYTDKEVSDYAVIELDREVSDRAPLVHRKYGRAAIGTPLLVIGHPMGLPMKISDGGEISRMNTIENEDKFQSWILRENYFTANLDSYAGNSGSPVFNKNTGKVEGIIVQGAEDFTYDEKEQCLRSQRRTNSHLETFEKVMRITKIPGI